MKGNLKVFSTAFLLSLPFWWAVNLSQEKLEDFFFWNKMAENPKLLLAQMAQEDQLSSLKPVRNRLQPEDPELTAQSAISVFIDKKGKEKILFEKDGQKPLPIASITKLMTAKVVLENYDIAQTNLAWLLYHLLISSDNGSAMSLAEVVGEDAFVSLMNLEAKKLGLSNTYFINPTGLDPDHERDPINYSTAQDLVELALHIRADQPLIWEITALRAFENSVNTNTLLEEFPEIVGGKTGWTPKAQGSLILVLKPPRGGGLLINVVLGSDNRSEDMKTLINWTNSSYIW